MGWIVAAGFLALCVGLTLLPRRTVPGRGLALLRCFFPSWRFFEEVELGPALTVAYAPPGADFEPWREFLRAPTRRSGALILNARGNLHLAFQSLVEQLWSELDEIGDASQLISYQLVANLIEFELGASGGALPGARFRFRVTADGRDPFESNAHELR